VHEELARNEEERIEKGGVILHKMSAASFLILALEIENTQ